MTSQLEAVRHVIAALQAAAIDYMIVGSHAASVHGFTRATHDLDIVVTLHMDDVSSMADSLGDDFFVDTESAGRAISRRDMFNVISISSGIKIDFFILPDDEFSRTQFSRRIEADFGGIAAWVASAEDTVVSKLLWYRITPSERQLGDVKGVIDAVGDRLDWEYISAWASKLGVEDLLTRAREL